MRMPLPRGPLSAWLSAALLTHPASPARLAPPVPAVATGPSWRDDDLQLALWRCYELHHRGSDDVAEEWEWHPLIVGFRRKLEQGWVTALHELGTERAAGVAAEGPDDRRRPEPHRTRCPAHWSNRDPVKTSKDHPGPQPRTSPAAHPVGTVGGNRARCAARGAGGRGAGHDQSHHREPRSGY